MGHKVKQSLMSSRIDFFYYAFRNILLVSIPLLVVCSIVLSHLSFHSSATGSGTDQIQFSLSVSCTLSSVVDSAHTKEITNGTYHSDVGKTTITTLCNDGNGYSVYANGYSNNKEGNTKLINAEHPEYSIDTGLATSGLTSAWAMKLNNIPDDPSPTPPVIEPAYNNTYGLVPQYWTRVASRPSGTTDMDEGSSFATTYAIYTTSNQHAGTYNGQVKYVLTHPSTQPYVYYMQEVDKWKNTIALEESVQAIDMRDGKKYWVTKLKDGNIWMTQNLDLDIGGANTAPLNSNNTDISTTASGSGVYTDGYSVNNGIYTWIPENSTTNSSWTNSVTKEYSYDPGNIYPDNLVSQQIAGSHGLSGNFYNWTAAIASNNSVNISSNGAANSVCPKNWRLPNYDDKELDNLFAIYGVITAIGSNTYSSNGPEKLVGAPLYFIRAGGIGDGGDPAFNVGTVGYSWYNDSDHTNSYTLRFMNNEIKTNYPDTKADGLTIRCVAR